MAGPWPNVPRGRGKRGWTLLEIVVAIVLIAMVIVVVAGMIPMGVNALRKAEAMQTASLYAVEVLEDARRIDFVPQAGQLYWEREVTFDKTLYRAQREIYAVDTIPLKRLYDVVVKVSWGDQPVPVELRTRVYKAY